MDIRSALAALDSAIEHANAQDAKDERGRRLVQVQHRDTNAWPHLYGMTTVLAAMLGTDPHDIDATRAALHEAAREHAVPTDQVQCPQCGALPGQPCRQRNGYAVPPHPTRTAFDD